MDPAGKEDHEPGGGPSSTELANERTRLAMQRTLMAWTRTTVSLVGFGFSIPKFLHVAGSSWTDERAAVRLGLMLIGIGALSLIAGMVDSILVLRKLQPGRPRRAWLSPGLLMSVAVMLVSAYAFLDVVTHVER